MSVEFYLREMVQVIDPRIKHNQPLILIVIAILIYRIYQHHESLFGIGYYVLGATLTYIGITIFMAAVFAIIKQSKEVHKK